MRAWPYPAIVAHRGGGKLAPENTLEAIEVGARLGLKMIEFDAKLSEDNVVFLLHDDDVDRTSNGHGAARSITYAQLASLDAGAWFGEEFTGARMPSFAQVHERCVALDLMANIEIKPCPGRDKETGTLVAQEAARLWADAPVAPLMSSFSFEALQAARDAAPHLPRGMRYDDVPDDWRAQTAALACVSLHANHRALDERLVGEIRDAGLRILAYTVNEPSRALARAMGRRCDLYGPHRHHRGEFFGRRGRLTGLKPSHAEGLAGGRQQHAGDQRQAADQRNGLPRLFVDVGVGAVECFAGALAEDRVGVVQTVAGAVEPLADLRAQCGGIGGGAGGQRVFEFAEQRAQFRTDIFRCVAAVTRHATCASRRAAPGISDGVSRIRQCVHGSLRRWMSRGLPAEIAGKNRGENP
ncbi:Glycerophosphoryl diester phosphodiesterase [Candidatus Burkholderia verschuerenii]|uniref:Glycerophosphoryl diester phosphodiesterase n=1 Tax=Candidatus Burkholderia verschuerenii TaxID=242163 RepID=A0A0L0MGE1_9BURK|nr:Glycerophosphoryl diester phosphodiesterase [Candidatus Burkholderia verschuerenii]